MFHVVIEAHLSVILLLPSIFQLSITMSKLDLDGSFIRQMFLTLSSYSIIGKIAVITGSFQGTGLAVAHVCAWAKPDRSSGMYLDEGQGGSESYCR